MRIGLGILGFCVTMAAIPAAHATGNESGARIERAGRDRFARAASRARPSGRFGTLRTSLRAPGARALRARTARVGRIARAVRHEFRTAQPVRNFARGTFVDGFVHSAHGIVGKRGDSRKQRVLKLAKFSGMLAGLAVVGAVVPWAALPIGMASTMMAVSAGGLAYSNYKKIPELRHEWRHDRAKFYRVLGEGVGYGAVVFGATAVAGHAILDSLGGGHEIAAGAAHHSGIQSMATQGLGAAAITFDAPVLVTGAQAEDEENTDEEQEPALHVLPKDVRGLAGKRPAPAPREG